MPMRRLPSRPVREWAQWRGLAETAVLRGRGIRPQHQNLNVLRRRIPPGQPQPREHPSHGQIDQLQPHDMASSQLAAIVGTLTVRNRPGCRRRSARGRRCGRHGPSPPRVFTNPERCAQRRRWKPFPLLTKTRRGLRTSAAGMLGSVPAPGFGHGVGGVVQGHRQYLDQEVGGLDHLGGDRDAHRRAGAVLPGESGACLGFRWGSG